MNHIDIIKSNSSFDLGKAVKANIDMIGVDNVIYATLKDVNISEVNEWPLVLACSSSEGELIEFEIRIRVLPLGAEGKEALELLEALKYAGFKIDEEKIKERFGLMMLKKNLKSPQMLKHLWTF